MYCPMLVTCRERVGWSEESSTVGARGGGEEGTADEARGSTWAARTLISHKIAR